MGATVNIHEAETQLSKLVEQAERGEDVVIARAGKPAVRLTRLSPPLPARKKRRLGILEGYDFHVPEDFNDLGREESKHVLR